MNPQIPFLLVSIQRIHAERIFSGAKLYELRKSLPKSAFSSVFLYETGASKIIGYFDHNEPIREEISTLWNIVGEFGTPKDRFFKYFSKNKFGCAIPIVNSHRFNKPIDTRQLRKEIGFYAPVSWLLIKPGTKLFSLLASSIKNRSGVRSVALQPISNKDKQLYISLVTSEIAPQYDDITEEFARTNLKTHRLGSDPNGIFTQKKQVLAIKLPTGLRIGFTTLTFKVGGCVKTGPTVLLKRFRGYGYGLATRRAIEVFVEKRACRKLYCTCPDNALNTLKYLLCAGFTIEAHLKQHYSESHGEIVLGKAIENQECLPKFHKIILPNASDFPVDRPKVKFNKSESFFRWALKHYWNLVDKDLAGNIVTNANLKKSTYEEKPVDILFFSHLNQTLGAAILIPKRGGAVKVLWFPYSSISHYEYMLIEIEKYLSIKSRRKIYFVHPLVDIYAINFLKSKEYISEGILKEPYSAGRDALVLSKIISSGYPKIDSLDILTG